MKVLLLTCSTGGGHNACAKAIGKELKERGIAFDSVDALDFTGKLKKQTIEKGHSFMYKYAPVLSGDAYDMFDQQKHHEVMFYDFARYGLSLGKYIREGGYDTAICAHIFPALMLTGARRVHLLDIKQYFVSTDYSFAPGLENTDMDGYFIPKGFTDEFSSKGLPKEKLIETGIPVDSALYKRQDKKEARDILGLREDKIVVLIGAGSIGCGPIKELALTIKEKSEGKAYVVVLCGNNKKLQKDLVSKVDDGLFLPIGFTSKINLWLSAADMMISKAGGLSSTEAVTLGLPLIFMDAVPGLETHNMNYYVENGVATMGKNNDAICQELIRLYEDPKACEKMLANQYDMFHENAVAKLVDSIS